MSFTNPFPSDLPLIKLKRTVFANGSVSVTVFAPVCFMVSPLGEYNQERECFKEFSIFGKTSWDESCLLAAYDEFLDDVAKIKSEYSDEIEYKEVESYHRMRKGGLCGDSRYDDILEPIDAGDLENDLKACADDLVRYMLEVQERFEKIKAGRSVVSEEFA
jgi:hypothetical protein